MPCDKLPAVIVDIDGTLADLTHRLRFVRERFAPSEGPAFKPDYDAFFSDRAVDADTPIAGIIALVRELHRAYKIILVTHRPAHTRLATIHWLGRHNIPYDYLYFSDDGDHRPDYIVKRERLEILRQKYHILFAIDDRQRVVDMYREAGVLTLQCDKGDF